MTFFFFLVKKKNNQKNHTHTQENNNSNGQTYSLLTINETYNKRGCTLQNLCYIILFWGTHNTGVAFKTGQKFLPFRLSFIFIVTVVSVRSFARELGLPRKCSRCVVFSFYETRSFQPVAFFRH